MITPDLRKRTPNVVNILQNQSPFEDLHIKITNPVSKLTPQEKDALEKLIQLTIKQNTSHLVTGTYTLGNIVGRPQNSIIVIEEGRIILNISSSQIIIMEQNASDIAIHFVKDLVIQLSELFVFVSGRKMIDVLLELDPDKVLHNQVYWLTSLNKECEIPKNIEIYHLDLNNSDLPVSHIEKISKKIWGYDSIEDIVTPHIVAMNKHKELLGGARINELTNNSAVIGGVQILKKHRRKGVGMAVSYALTKRLRQKQFEIFLETDDNNIPAQKIYKRIGFEQVGKSAFLDFGTNIIPQIIGDRDY